MTVIFDLDGTLLDTIDDLGAACNEALREHGFPLHTSDEYRGFVGNGINRLIYRALPDNHRFEHTVLKLKETFVAYYNSHLWEHTHPYPGIVDMLTQCRQMDWHLAVASNKYQSAAEHIVNHFFPGTFDIIEGERQGRERKPNPQIVFDILHWLGEQGNVWYVGDSAVDIATAANAGVHALACTWGFATEDDLREAHATQMVHQPAQIIDCLRQSF